MNSDSNQALRVLVLEDKADDFELIERILRRMGRELKTRWVEDRTSFVAALSDFKPDVILADYSLPDLNGAEALTLAGASCPDVPFILVTDTLSEEAVIEVFKAGWTDFVSKRKLARLIPAVERALREKEEHHERRMEREALDRSNRLIRLLQVVAVAANEAASPNEVLPTCLKQICAHLGWITGHVFQVVKNEEGESLVSTGIWYADERSHFESLAQVTQNLRFGKGEGIPGAVWKTGKPTWRSGSTLTDSKLPRTKLACELGVKTALLFPIPVGDEIVAVAEFSSSKVEEPDSVLLGIMEQISVQLGRVFERERAREELSRSLVLLTATIESTEDGILVVDPGGRIVKFNRRFQEMWRIPDSVLNAKDDDRALAFVLDQVADPDAFLYQVRALYSQPQAEVSDIIRFKDGRIFERYSRPQSFESSLSGRVWSFRDVTEKMRVLEQLQESEARYRLLFESNPHPMWVHDLETGAFLAVNDAAIALYGYTREEFSAMTIRDLRLPEDISRLREGYAPASYAVESAELLRHRKKNGAVIEAQVTSHALIFAGRRARVVHAHDLTERLKVERELKRSEERLKESQRIARVGSWQWNLQTDEIIWSDELFRIYGYAAQAFKPTTEAFWKHVHPDDRPRVMQEMTRSGASSEAIHGEMRVVQSDGTTIFVHTTIEILDDDQGRPLFMSGTAQDITERKRSEEALRESEERYALAVRGTQDGVWDWNIKANRAFFSPRFKEILGFSEDDLGHNPFDWIERVHIEDRPLVEEAFRSHILNPSHNLEIEFRMLHKDGEYRWALCRGLATRNEKGEAYRLAGSISDITERKKVEAQLLHDAFHDGLTGLPNRALFLDRLEHAIERARRNKGTLFAVIFLDADRFKNINDSLGHLVGDRFLIEMSRRIVESVRPGDSVARLGGDEFAILLEDLKDVAEAARVADAIIQSMGRAFDLDGREIFAGASVGIALDDVHYTRGEEILRDADTAMYRAKSAGKGRYEIFDSSMRERAVVTLNLENDLRRALDRKEFELYYQPIVQIASHKIVGFEALLRWRHPERGVLLPTEFISACEETGLILPLGRWVIEEACGWLSARAKNNGQGNGNVWVSVNVSTRQFRHTGFVEDVAGIIHKSGIDPKKLKLEMTESVIMENAESATAMLLHLRALELQICVDDFGTGYSSLNYLQSLPIDVLKIDRSFVTALGRGSKNTEIVRAIIALAHVLGLAVTAEGVESKEQLSLLAEWGCEYAQGFYFAPALGASEAASWSVSM